MGLEEDSEIVKALEGLKDLNLESGAEGTLIKNCQTLEVECAKGMAEKVVCTKHDGYKVLVQTLNAIPVSTTRSLYNVLVQFVSFNSLPLKMKTVKFSSILAKLAGKAIQIH